MAQMDEATYKVLRNAHSQLLSAAAMIKRLLDDDKPQRVTTQDLRCANIAGVVTTEILQKSADTPAQRD